MMLRSQKFDDLKKYSLEIAMKKIGTVVLSFLLLSLPLDAVILPFKEFCEALEVSSTDSKEDIKDAFKKFALLYHPDKNPGQSKEAELYGDISETKRYWENNGYRPYYHVVRQEVQEELDTLVKLVRRGAFCGSLVAIPILLFCNVYKEYHHYKTRKEIRFILNHHRKIKEYVDNITADNSPATWNALKTFVRHNTCLSKNDIIKNVATHEIISLLNNYWIIHLQDRTGKMPALTLKTLFNLLIIFITITDLDNRQAQSITAFLVREFQQLEEHAEAYFCATTDHEKQQVIKDIVQTLHPIHTINLEDCLLFLVYNFAKIANGIL